MRNRITYLCLLGALLSMVHHATAQIIWDGGGDGTSWNDAANWEGDVLPGSSDIAEINSDVTLTGVVATPPAQLKLGGRANVIIKANATFGNTTSGQHAINIGAKCNIFIGDGTDAYTVTIAAPNDKNGLTNFASGDSSTIMVATNATLNIIGASNGINLVAANTVFQNEGTIQIEGNVKTGVKTAAIFQNKGTILISELATDGILVNGGVFTNEGTGKIMISKVGDDGIEVIDVGTFNNEGEISGIGADNASANKNVIAVGTADTIGYFNNNGVINADGGSSTTTRAIYVYEEGIMTNSGTINARGGNTGTTLYSRNVLVNAKNGVMNFDKGRLNINKGSFVNNGLIVKTGGGSGIFSSDSLNTLVNNAFFKYDSSGVFAGGNGIITDNGAKLNNINRLRLDALGDCFVDIVETAYDWYIDGVLYASSDDDGRLDFGVMSLMADSVILTTTLPDVNIKITNICNTAVMTSSVSDLLSDAVKLYPSIASEGYITIESQEQGFLPSMVIIYDHTGREVEIHSLQLVSINTVDVSGLYSGIYFIRLSDGAHQWHSKFYRP